jgi:hypothetical protein
MIWAKDLGYLLPFSVMGPLLWMILPGDLSELLPFSII